MTADASAPARREEAYAVSSWIFQIEQIAMTATRRQTRMLGLVGNEAGAGVSQIAELMATSFAKAQRRTLLLDLRAPVDYAETPPDSWAPGSADIARHIAQDPRGFFRLRPIPTVSTRPLFNNVELMRACVDKDLQRFEQIVVDMSNLSDSGADNINPVGPSVACDGVILVCMTGRTTRTSATRAVDRLQTAGAKVAGTLLNDEENVSLGGDIARLARRMRWLSPAFARRMERLGRTSGVLN